jgi:hypothetical protein
MLLPCGASGGIGSNVRVSRLITCALLFLVSMPTVWRHPSEPADSPSAVPQFTAEQWRADLRHFAEQMPKRHNNLFHTMTQAQFTNAVQELDQDRPSRPRS